MKSSTNGHSAVLADVLHEALDGKPLLSSEWSWAEQTRALIAHKAYENGSD